MHGCGTLSSQPRAQNKLVHGDRVWCASERAADERGRGGTPSGSLTDAMVRWLRSPLQMTPTKVRQVPSVTITVRRTPPTQLSTAQTYVETMRVLRITASRGPRDAEAFSVTPRAPVPRWPAHVCPAPLPWVVSLALAHALARPLSLALLACLLARSRARVRARSLALAVRRSARLSGPLCWLAWWVRRDCWVCVGLSGSAPFERSVTCTSGCTSLASISSGSTLRRCVADAASRREDLASSACRTEDHSQTRLAPRLHNSLDPRDAA